MRGIAVGQSLPTLALIPCLEAATAPPAAVLSASSFAYIGTGLTLPEFRQYVASYDFGTILPDQLVIHNTANPDASWAPLTTTPITQWDRNEAGMSPSAIYEKRRYQLDKIRDYYISLGWPSGPHLFVDDRYIWLFTPMYDVGTHAKEGNSHHDSAGRLHYTLGIEVVGWYGRVGWPLSIQALLRGAVQALRDRLKTFEIVYRPAPPHQPQAHQGSIAFHRDYNKPECPGAFITPEYAIPILKASEDPLKQHLIAGPPGTRSYYCSAALLDLYTGRGGFSLFGYALADETRDGDSTFMVWERAVAKTSAQYGVELALLTEARARGWLT